MSDGANSSISDASFSSSSNTSSLASPSSSSSSCILNSPPSILKFSIESILQPTFGRRQEIKSPALPVTSPKLVDERSLFPAWVYCTRYSDRPSAGPRSRRTKRKADSSGNEEDKRPRTAFTSEQLERLRQEFLDNRYLTEKRRQEMAHELGLNESQIKIWFQNKRAKLKKASGERPVLALHLMAQGLYNHTASSLTRV